MSDHNYEYNCHYTPPHLSLYAYSIFSADHSTETCLQLKHSTRVPRDQTKGFTVQFVWKSTSFDRHDTCLYRLV